ncbi:hypothetical protein CAPTEDRAFT_155657 [Capitella teleta]|uniref:Uncharacterized protein n=1 Tax=Capitella teleta TaxID=283909 RepID=R7V3T5_CAPTE|nr:hypothetical protein CAPTEDRAFT_155657 [Capitella teleta]|eukprot:ELU13518.1 hypothetical protein CAPTEDRAFT_155657 [Capitella teleta]
MSCHVRVFAATEVSVTDHCALLRPDTLIYAASVNISGLPDVMNILSDVSLRPQITGPEIEESGLSIQWEIEALNMNPDPEPLLMEMIHTASYSRNTLGLPKVTPLTNVPVIDKKLLYTFMQNYHTPERMVVAGVGVDHQSLVDLTKKYFITKKPIWEEDSSLIDKSRGQDLSISQFTGGEHLVEKDLSNVSLGPTPMPELAHVVIGLESCSHNDDDFVAFCVLNMLMGGGGSFSAGGPGKGMYSRLYLNVLNRLHWIESATAYNHAYADSGIFCIHASAHPSQLRDLTEVVTTELVRTAQMIGPSELMRAKTQLQSMLLMNLESRPVMFEDVARQVLARGHRLPATHYFDEIGSITAEDIERVAKRMLQSKPAVTALGSLNNMPSYTDISKALSSNGKLPALRKYSLFR